MRRALFIALLVVGTVACRSEPHLTPCEKWRNAVTHEYRWAIYRGFDRDQALSIAMAGAGKNPDPSYCPLPDEVI